MRRRWIGLAGLAAVLALAGPAVAVNLDGTISTVAGTGIAGRTGDGGPATAAAIGHPRGIALQPDGGFVFAEPFNATVRRVLPDGTITTVAGTGVPGFSGDGGPAAGAQLNLPHGVASTISGGLLIADTLNHRIRLVTPAGTIGTVVGTGVPGFSGDGGTATAAELDTPRGIASLPDGGFVIADTNNHRIRRVLQDGTVTTVAGTGGPGFSGDGGPATAAELSSPFGVAVDRDGGLLVVDTGNNRIRRVAPDGTIATAAGSGVRGFSGDGGAATAAALDQPHAVAGLPGGGFLIADTGNNRVRHVWPDGRITTAAGSGAAGFAGDGGSAVRAQLDEPKAVAAFPTGQGFLVADSANNRIRFALLDLRVPMTVRLLGPPVKTHVGSNAVLRFTLTTPATVRLEVRRQARLVLAIKARRSAGSNALAFGRRLRAGSYRLVLTVSDGSGRTVRIGSSLQVAA